MANISNSSDGTSSGRTLSRRRMLTTLSAAGAGGIAGCTGMIGGGSKNSGTNGTIKLDYWTLFAGGDGKAMKSMVKKFNDQHDGIQIKRQRLPWDAYYNKLYTSLTGGNAPDIAVIHATRLLKYSDYLVGLDDHLSSGAQGKYVNAMWNKSSVGDRRVTLPLDAHPVGLWYNKNIFEEAGLDPEKPPQSFSELEDKANTIVKETDSLAFNPGPYGGASMLRSYLAFLKQRGGSLLNEKKTKATFDSENGYAIGKFYRNLTGKWNWDKPNTAEDRGTKAFRAGDMAMVVNGTWYYGVCEEQDFDYGMAKPYVAPGKKRGATWANSHTLGVPMKKSRSKEKEKAAAKAVKWLTQHSKEWATTAGHLPASQSVLESDDLRSSKVWNKSLSTFYEMANKGNIAYVPRTKKILEYKRPISKNINEIYGHKQKPRPALDEAAKKVDKILK
ncbi:hypothetical protein DMJ13_24780 [halophilic archaeon]|nr:hypothetical protein DMJ13_24780 [halophilic archaeon]